MKALLRNHHFCCIDDIVRQEQQQFVIDFLLSLIDYYHKRLLYASVIYVLFVFILCLFKSSEIRRNGLFSSLPWDNLLQVTPDFIPQPTNDTDTGYFKTGNSNKSTTADDV